MLLLLILLQCKMQETLSDVITSPAITMSQ